MTLNILLKVYFIVDLKREEKKFYICCLKMVFENSSY